MLEIVISHLKCLTSTRYLFQPCFVEIMTMRTRLDLSSNSFNWNEKPLWFRQS